MSDFSNYAGSDNGRPKTVKFDFPHFKGEPWLEIKQANETNKPYYNGLLRFQRRFRRGRNVTVEDVATNRENDRYLYAKHVIVGWGNVSDKSGESVPLSEESCKEFLRRYPDNRHGRVARLRGQPTQFYRRRFGRRGTGGKLTARLLFELRNERDGFQVEAAQKKGRPLPDWFAEQPDLQPGDDFWLSAFFELSTTRHDGGPIPWDKIMLYADRSGLDGDLAGTLQAVIRSMDSAFLKWTAEQRKRDA